MEQAEHLRQSFTRAGQSSPLPPPPAGERRTDLVSSFPPRSAAIASVAAQRLVEGGTFHCLRPTSEVVDAVVDELDSNACGLAIGNGGWLGRTTFLGMWDDRGNDDDWAARVAYTCRADRTQQHLPD